MATPHEKPIKESSPLQENEETEEEYMEDYEETFAAGGCDCFRVFCFRWRRRNDGAHRILLQQQGEYRETWWVNRAKKVKEISELLAGPKWKTFIRKLGSYGNNKKRRTQFQYDPHSYALNFDSGFDKEGDGDAHTLISQHGSQLRLG